jgi:KipI family sensor histidine kinase inhibitor
MHPSAPRIEPFGERAWLLELGDGIDEEVNRRILAVAAGIEARLGELGDDGGGVERPVVAYSSLLVAFDPISIGAGEVRELIRDVAHAMPVTPAAPSAADHGPIVEIAVRYGGIDGPDLPSVASRLGLSSSAVVALHSGTDYRVFMLGFAPGFAYLGTLPPALILPRLAEPRTLVPAGSVAIAGRQTGVYPVDTPGGWHLIGRTDEPLWDPRWDPPARLAPGDRVRFVPA